MTTSPVRLIVGLGNPGDEHTYTRHNAGVWLVEALAHYHQISFRHDIKLKSSLAHFITEDASKIFLAIPTTFMNHSGQAVKLVSDFYDISPESILIAHDELDMPAGEVRLKFAGGHGGHNGLRDIIGHLHSHDFYRLRIGIGHPGAQSLVSDYVLSRPPKAEKTLIETGIQKILDLRIIEHLLAGHGSQAMQVLHTKIDSDKK